MLKDERGYFRCLTFETFIAEPLLVLLIFNKISRSRNSIWKFHSSPTRNFNFSPPFDPIYICMKFRFVPELADFKNDAVQNVRKLTMKCSNREETSDEVVICFRDYRLYIRIHYVTVQF